jgi:hypothetical protein
LDEKALRKLVTRLKLKKRAKKLRDQTSDDLTASDPLSEKREKRSKKKKPASKVAFKRVDQREFLGHFVWSLLYPANLASMGHHHPQV